MTHPYYAVVTDLGTKKMIKAINEGKKVNITHMAVGDGGGSPFKPTTDMTELKNEVWRGTINSCRVSEESENLLIIESILPYDVGGFTVREMAAFDDKGDMIAICNTPETQKVRISDGVPHQIRLELEIAVSNTDSVQLVVDPNIVTATKRDIEELRVEFKEELQTHMSQGTTGIYKADVIYKSGDYCLYENILHKCIQDTQGEWNAECWKVTSPLEEVENLRNKLNKLTDMCVNMKGATESADGEAGLVPAPDKGKQNQYLKGNATWENMDDHEADFTAADSRSNISPGDKIKIIFGKIAKVFADMGTAAYYALANNLATTEPGFAMDARVGPVIDNRLMNLEEQYDELNSALGKMHHITYVYSQDSMKNDLKIWFADFTNKYKKDIVDNGGAIFYTSISGIMEYSGVALPTSDSIRYICVNDAGILVAIMITLSNNNIRHMYSIALNSLL